MQKNSSNIIEENLYEWLCSVGYLLPSNEQELYRFEKLHPPHSIKVNEDSVDPFAIINGTRERKPLSFTRQSSENEEQAELRMAARKHQGLSSDILDRIRKNQDNNDKSDRSENQ